MGALDMTFAGQELCGLVDEFLIERGAECCCAGDGKRRSAIHPVFATDSIGTVGEAK
jgi:hypothetical protein